jgi:REP element-mobilizing transposase RayT
VRVGGGDFGGGLLWRAAHMSRQDENKRHPVIPNAVYFITVKTKNNFPFFQERLFADLWLEELQLCQKSKKFIIHAFCLVYTHFHIVLEPVGVFNQLEIMQSLKKESSRDLNYLISGAIPEWRRKGTEYSDRTGAVYLVPRLDDYLALYQHDECCPRFRWKKSFNQKIVLDETAYSNFSNYTAYNFLKHGLPDDWPYTSARYPDLVG